MKNAFCHIEICTTNLKKAEKFYAELFGWKIQSEVMGKYSLFETPSPPGGGLAEVKEVKPGDSLMLYVEVDDIEKYLKKAANLGGKQVSPKTEIPQVGWYGVFSDLDGNKIGLFTGLAK